MSSNNDPSLDDLRARAELSRAALAANVTELRGRVARVASPENIKAEVRSYARHEREGLVDGLRKRAAENPRIRSRSGASSSPIFTNGMYRR